MPKQLDINSISWPILGSVYCVCYAYAWLRNNTFISKFMYYVLFSRPYAF